MKTLPKDTIPFVSEDFLRRKFPGWRTDARWHRGDVVFGYEDCDMIALPSVGVNVMISDLKRGDMLIAVDPFDKENSDE